MSEHQQEEREYPREDGDLTERPFVGRWPNPAWVGLLEDDREGEP